MLNSTTELITLAAGLNYEPTFVRTDKRIPPSQPTTLGYYQIGEIQQYGFAKGPIFRVEFVDLSAVAATYIKIWGLDNIGDTGVVYPITYLTTWKPTMDIYLKKFVFSDVNGNEVLEANDYTIVGHKKRAMPIAW